MGGKAPQQPVYTPPPPVQETDPAIEDRKRKAAEEERRRKGLASTILTSGQGEDENQLNIGTKTLLGQ